MADYLVPRNATPTDPNFGLHRQHGEEHLLLLGLVPGQDFVMIPNVISDQEAIRHAEKYFRGEYQDSRTIDCWVAGAVERQRCLRSG